MISSLMSTFILVDVGGGRTNVCSEVCSNVCFLEYLVVSCQYQVKPVKRGPMRLLLSIATLLIVFVGVSHPLESNIPYIEWHPSENILAVSLGNSLQILDGTSLEIVNALFEVEEEIHTFA